MINLLQRLCTGFAHRESSARKSDSFRPHLEALEDRQLPTVTSMTGLAQLFPRHSGPTMVFLNFDGNTSQGVSSFTSPSGNAANRTQDIHEIMYRVSEIFAPFDVQVRRIYGNGAMDTTANNSTTVFIGDMTSNGTGVNNKAYAGTPWANSDYPGQVLGFHHAPNSNAFDVAYVDPVAWMSNWSNTQIARNLSQEVGHTFGLSHVLSLPVEDIMSYNAANTRFVNQTFNLTDLNFNGSATVHDARETPQWYTTYNFGWGNVDLPNNIVTQNSYTYLRTVLGAPTAFGDGIANVADRTAVDASFVDGYMPTFSIYNASYTTTGTVNHGGDYDVFQFSTWSSKWVNIDVQRFGSSSLDSVLMVYDSTGQQLLAFNDDSNGTVNSHLQFYSTLGQTYRIVVGGYGNNSTGDYQLTVSSSIGPVALPPTLSSTNYLAATLDPQATPRLTSSVLLNGSNFQATAPQLTQQSPLPRTNNAANQLFSSLSLNLAQSRISSNDPFDHVFSHGALLPV